jgi:hypothetical protein
MGHVGAMKDMIIESRYVVAKISGMKPFGRRWLGTSERYKDCVQTMATRF